MAKYNVIQDFIDLQDKGKVYRKDDTFPKPVNKRVSNDRVKELTSKDNKQGRPVIKERD